MIDLPKWAKDVMKTLVPPVSAPQKVSSPEEEFSNQVGRVTRSVESQSLSPPRSLSSEPMNRVAMVAEMRVMLVLNNMDFHSPRLSWLHLLLIARSASRRDRH